jgi:hypothetical protein
MRHVGMRRNARAVDRRRGLTQFQGDRAPSLSTSEYLSMVIPLVPQGPGRTPRFRRGVLEDVPTRVLRVPARILTFSLGPG